VEEFSGDVTVEPRKSGGLELTLADGGGGRRLTTVFDGAAVEAMDVRDKAVLAERRSALQRDRMLWRVLQTAVGGLILAGLLELGMIAGGVLLRQQREAQAQLAPEVERIQTAQALGTRIEEMSRRRLRPFEMLAVLNAVRPPGVLFTRSVTNGQGSLEIEGQTANADAVGAFESALRALPSIETLEVRDLRLRDGLTTFQLSASFREGTLATVAGTGAPAPTTTPGGAK
jgi:Tfp pilus assembly protein PilN